MGHVNIISVKLFLKKKVEKQFMRYKTTQLVIGFAYTMPWYCALLSHVSQLAAR